MRPSFTFCFDVHVQDGGYGGVAGQQHPHGVGGEGGLGIWSRFKEKVFQGDAGGGDEEGSPR